MKEKDGTFRAMGCHPSPLPGTGFQPYKGEVGPDMEGAASRKGGLRLQVSAGAWETKNSTELGEEKSPGLGSVAKSCPGPDVGDLLCTQAAALVAY